MHSIWPVSYTHLITDNTLTRNDTGDGDAVYDLVLNADGLDEDYSYQLKVREEPVSYTHLDVYKRQEQ